MKRDTLVLAIGNAGGNIAGYVRKETKCKELQSCHFVSANADKESHSFRRLKAIGITAVHLRPNVYKVPANIFRNIRNLIIIAGLGGETGTEYLVPIIDQALSARVNSVVAFLTLPFSFEGDKKMVYSIEAISKLSNRPNIKICVLNNEHILAKHSESNIFSVLNEAECLIMQYMERCVTEEIIDYSPTQIDVTQDPFEAGWLKPVSTSDIKPKRRSNIDDFLYRIANLLKKLFSRH